MSQGSDRQVVVRLVKCTAPSVGQREDLGRASTTPWLSRPKRGGFIRLGEPCVNERIQMAPDRSSRETEICRQRTSGGGARFQQHSGDPSGRTSECARTGIGFHNLIVSYFLATQHPRPARATSLCNYAAPETASHCRNICAVSAGYSICAQWPQSGRIVTRLFFSTAAALGANSTGTS